jgi:hypothetical protein
MCFRNHKPNRSFICKTLLKFIVVGDGTSAIPPTRSELKAVPVYKSTSSISGYLSMSKHIGTCSTLSIEDENAGVAVGLSMI